MTSFWIVLLLCSPNPNYHAFFTRESAVMWVAENHCNIFDIYQASGTLIANVR